MKTRFHRSIAALVAAATLTHPGPDALAQAGKGAAAAQDRPGLPRVREGGTPYDPSQPLHPYAIGLPSGAAAGAAGTVISSPPEYAPSRGVLYAYGTSYNSVVAALVASLTGSTAHDEVAYVVVPNQATATSAASAFSAAGANLSKVTFLVHPVDSVWMRDYGPHFVFQGGALAAVDSHYYPTRANDNFIPTLVARGGLDMQATHIPLYYSGGNFQPGPNRSGFVTALINLDNPSSQGFTEPYLRELHAAFKGIDTLHVLPQLPTSVDGTGHVDMWMYLVDQDTAVISEFIAGSNATATSVTNNAVPYMQALGFEVIRTPAWNAGLTHYTYTNAFRVNDRIFVPVYGTGIVAGGNSAYNARDTEAMARWAAAAGPGVSIVPIQCNGIIAASGAIHCIVKQVPRYSAPIPAVHVIAPALDDLWPAGTQQVIRWNATDTDNRPLQSVDLAYSTDGGTSWTPIASGVPDSGWYAWNVPAGAGSGAAMVSVTARSAGGAQVTAMSNPYRQVRATRRTADFGANAGIDRFGFGRTTAAWTNVSGIASPVTTALVAANYASLATSNATGGTTDAGRYVPPTVTGGAESTHLFRFTVTEPVASIAELKLRWEGFADRCTQVEVYAWNRRLSQWGDAQGRTGQNRFMANWAGNADEVLEANIRTGIADFVGPDGTVAFLVYADRSNDRILHDWMELTVTTVPPCPADSNGDGVVDGVDLGMLLGQWGPCAGCTLDLNQDSVVDGIDLGLLLGAWGPCP